MGPVGALFPASRKAIAAAEAEKLRDSIPALSEQSDEPNNLHEPNAEITSEEPISQLASAEEQAEPILEEVVSEPSTHYEPLSPANAALRTKLRRFRRDAPKDKSGG